jgi:hypothetical protein
LAQATGCGASRSAGGGGEVAAERQFTIGRFNPTVNIDLNARLNGKADLALIAPTYVFATPVLGGQLAIGVTGLYGRNNTSIDGTLTVSVNNLIATRFGSISDARNGFGDLYPMASLRWNQGVHNYMIYATGDIPVGTYDSSRLANFGIGHGAIDGGVGYTYFNPQKSHEFFVVTGLTSNFKNGDTNYRNGIDWHLDWGASKFLSKQFFVGGVGYFYQQLTADSGAPLILGDNISRVAGIGPQIGYIFPLSEGLQGYLNLKAYKEFGASRRGDGYNTWLTFAISPAEAPTQPRKPLITK